MDLPPGPWLPAAAESLVDAAAARLTAAFTANTTKGNMCVPPAPRAAPRHAATPVQAGSAAAGPLPLCSAPLTHPRIASSSSAARAG
jgi:hypothetical protein